MKKISIFILFAGLLALDVFAIQVTPTYQMFTVKAGSKATGHCTVSNNEDENLSVTMSSKDWFILPGNEKFRATEWLTFKDKTFDLKKGESKEVEFYVAVPKEAKGELIGMMSFELAGEIQSNVNKVLSVAIYGAVQGTEVLKGELKAMMVLPSSNTLTVSVLMTNKGNVHIRPEGFFEIKDSKDQVVANIFFQQGPPTYPGKEGVYTGRVSDFKIKPGEYKCNITLTDIDRKVKVVSTTRKFEILETGGVELR